MKWIPIDEAPDEWKDGRLLAAWFYPNTDWVPISWEFDAWRNNRALEVNPTHLMDIVGPE